MALADTERREMQRGMLNIFEKFAWPPVSLLHRYIPMVDRGEADTESFEAALKKVNPGLQVAVPAVEPETGLMASVLLRNDTIFQTASLGMQEPASGEKILPLQIDMVLVPLLAFDRAGQRVGYGRGFYDRFLPLCRPDCLRVGLSFFGPLEKIADAGEMDVPLTHCITPDRIYEF